MGVRCAELTGSKGTVTARVADRFRWPYWGNEYSEWEIAGFPGDRTYGPSGLGGCPVVTCRLIAGEPDPITAHFTENRLCDWCGDSVATALIASAIEARSDETRSGSAEGESATPKGDAADHIASGAHLRTKGGKEG